MLFVKTVEPVDVVIKALQRNWKESEHEAFQETSLEKVTKVQQQVSRPGIEERSGHKLSVHFTFSGD